MWAEVGWSVEGRGGTGGRRGGWELDCGGKVLEGCQGVAVEEDGFEAKCVDCNLCVELVRMRSD